MTIQKEITPTPDGNYASALNASLDGWNVAMAVSFVLATADEVVAEIQVSSVHHQPYGIVHGGTYAGLIETVTSTGATLSALQNGRYVVGLDNHTSFLNAVREGKLRATAKPLMRGRRTQVWEATVTDANGRAAATGRVRFLVLEADANLVGETVRLKL